MKKIQLLFGLALVAAVPLFLSAHVEDVFFMPWRAGLWAYMGALTAWTGYAWLRGAGSPALSMAELPWALLAVWAMVSPAWSVNPADSMRRAAELGATILALWVGIACAREYTKAWTAVMVSIGATSVYGLAQSAGIDPMPWTSAFGGRAFGTLGNPDYYAGHLILVLPLAASWLVGRPAFSRTLGFAFILFVAGFLLSQVRGAWMAAIALMPVFAWHGWKMAMTPLEKQRVKRGAGAVALVFAAMLAVDADMRSRAASILQMGGYDGAGRRYLWRVAGTIWKDGFIKGFGANGYRYHFPRYQQIGESMNSPEFRSYSYSEHAHNEVLQFGAELGVVGVGLFVWGLAAWWLRWRRGFFTAIAEGRRQDAWTLLGTGMGITGCFIYSWVNFPLQIVPTALLWWFMMGASLEKSGAGRRYSLTGSPARAAGAAALALGLAAAFMGGVDMAGNGYLKELHGRITISDNRGAVWAGPRAERLVGYDYRVYRWMSRLGIVLNDEEMMERGVQVRLKIHPFMAEPYSDRMEFMRKLGRNDEAMKRALELVEKAPNYGNGWGILGEIYFEKKQYALSAEAFGKAAWCQWNNPTWHHNQAAAFGVMKKYREAMAADQRAIDVAPGFIDAYLTQALSAKATGDRKTALAIVEKARQINPEDPRIYTLLKQLE
jgi:hypothetical protein